MILKSSTFRRISMTLSLGFGAVLILGFVYIEDVRDGFARLADDVACYFISDMCVN